MKTLKRIAAAAMFVVLISEAAFPVVWTTAYHKLSYWSSRAVTNAVPRVAQVVTTATDNSTAIAPPTGLTYGDRIWAMLEGDSVVGAGGGDMFYEVVPLDSVRWNLTHDSLRSGVELAPRFLIFWDDIDGL
jgi:hypothetical protein